MSKHFRFEDHAASHTGKVRAQNEDSMAGFPGTRVWVVADGMGGAKNGRDASRTVVEALSWINPPEDIEAACDAVAAAIHEANGEIFARSQAEGQQMGTTVVALVLRGDEFAVLWAGDSRVYLFRDDQLIQLTRDHTQVESMIERGLLAEEEARTHPMKHVLARAVGVEENLQLDAIRDEIELGDVFLLCSDGLHGVLDDDEIADFVREQGPTACNALVEACLERGAPDNVTVSMVLAREPTLLSFAGVEA